MKLESVVQDGWIEYFWKSAGEVVSPTFTKKTLALEWYSLHSEHMDQKERNLSPNLMYIKSNN